MVSDSALPPDRFHQASTKFLLWMWYDDMAWTFRVFEHVV
jgi:hypothetical protein